MINYPTILESALLIFVCYCARRDGKLEKLFWTTGSQKTVCLTNISVFFILLNRERPHRILKNSKIRLYVEFLKTLQDYTIFSGIFHFEVQYRSFLSMQTVLLFNGVAATERFFCSLRISNIRNNNSTHLR